VRPSPSGHLRIGDYPEPVFDLDRVDLGEIPTALQDQGGYERRWLINPDSGEIAFWTEDTGIGGHNPVDLDDLDLIVINPLPSYGWYQDMADFAQGVSDERAGRRLARDPWPWRISPLQSRAARGVSAPAAGLVRLP
jgi:hypothetical protein